MKITHRSSDLFSERRFAGARSLYRANGMKDEHFGKPIIAIANSFTQFVPGHTHLHSIGQYVKSIIESKGYFAAEFNTIAIDDGIAMGHDGMLYSLPSRELIADSVEYMCNAHKVDALICISNCDKITPGMLLASVRLNIPTVFISGGPMEAGKIGEKKIDLVDAMVFAGNENNSIEEINEYERSACPTCGSCSGMFTANSMNCLTEALGLSLPGNGTIIATHKNRLKLFIKAANLICDLAEKYYQNGDSSILPKSILIKETFQNAMTLDIAMGGSTNTILHLLALANEAGIDFTLDDIDELSKNTPCLCKVSPNSSFHIEDVNHSGGIISILGELNKSGLIHLDSKRVDGLDVENIIKYYDVRSKDVCDEAISNYLSAPGGNYNIVLGSQNNQYEKLDYNRKSGCIRDVESAYSTDGGLAVLKGNIAPDGCVVKSAGIKSENLYFKGKAIVFQSQEDAVDGILSGKVVDGHVVVICYEGPKGGPGMQEMLYPTSYLKSKKLDENVALITDGRFSGGTSGLSIGHISPEAASQGAIGLIRNNDIIEIDIRSRKINALLSDEELIQRRSDELKKGNDAFKPIRERIVPKSLLFYSQNVSSADKGAVRIIN